LPLRLLAGVGHIANGFCINAKPYAKLMRRRFQRIMA
jgi:hypothetical protein